MSRNKHRHGTSLALVTGILALAATLLLPSGVWSANRLDMWYWSPGDLQNPFDDWDGVCPTFVSQHLMPWHLYLYVDASFNAIDPATNTNAVSTWQALWGVREACRAWNDISISSFQFDEGVPPFNHTFAKFPGQVIVPGSTGLDGWNLVTFQDPTLSLGGGAVGMSMSWVFWRDFDLKSFTSLQPGIIIVDPPGSNPPTGGLPQAAQIDFNGDGISDIIIEARKYRAGEVIESDTWLNQIEAWHQWPDDPNDLPTTPGGQITRPDTLGTLDIQGVVTHELGHLMGIGHANLERATMYWLLKGSYVQGYRYPTDVWEMRTLDLDDHIAAGLLYPKRDNSRGTIAGEVLDGRNFDGLPDRVTSGVIDPILYGTVYVCRWMTTDIIPAYIPDKLLFTSQTALTQQQLDTSSALWLELLTEVQTGHNIRTAIWPNPASLAPNGLINNQAIHIEAASDYHIAGLFPFDRYLIFLDNAGVYYNDSAGIPTDNISTPFSTFFGYQPIPSEFYGGNVDPGSRNVLGPDAATPYAIVTTQPLTVSGDIPTSYVYVPVYAGQVTAPIVVYTNTGGLPPGVTPTPIPGITPTPPPLGNTRFTNTEFLVPPPVPPIVPRTLEFGVAAAVGDIDNDGDLDLYVCNAVSATSTPISLINRLFLNDRGDEITPRSPNTTAPMVRRFVDVSFGPDNIPGTADDRMPLDLDLSFGALMADFDLDGYTDIFVSNAETLSSQFGAENRLYLNRGWGHLKGDAAHMKPPGWFDDVTAFPRVDPAIGIPTRFTATIMPGILNYPPFTPYPDPLVTYLPGDFLYGDWFNRATKSDAGDIDSDGDIDIVVATMNMFPDVVGSYSPQIQYTVFPYLFFSERILINHANDFDSRTRGFYFTDETLGMDCRFGEATATSFPYATTWTSRQAADRLPPIYPDWFQPPAIVNQQSASRTYQVVLAPLFGDGSLDLVVFNRSQPILWAPYVSTRDGFDAIYENVDITENMMQGYSPDGVQDGYFRLVNAGFAEYEYGMLNFLPVVVVDPFAFPPTLTTVTAPLGWLTSTGTGGLGRFQGDPGHSPPEGNIVQFTQNDAFGGTVGDFNYFGYNMPLALDGTNGHILYTVGGAGCSRGPVFGGEALLWTVYGWNGWFIAWTGMNLTNNPLPGFNPYLSRGAAVADFDYDGDMDVYVGFQKMGAEGTIAGPAPGQYFTNNGFAAFTNSTVQATSEVSRGTYHVMAFDFDNDSDLDIYRTNSNTPHALLLNRLFDGRPDLFNPNDNNPLFCDATPQFLPPYNYGNSAPPFSGLGSNMTVSCAAGDLTGDDLPDVVCANGALFTVSGDDTDVYINHGKPMNAGTPILSPIHATWPAPKIASFEWYRLGRYVANFDYQLRAPYDEYRLNVRLPAYDVAMADFDLDGDYDVILSSLGLGPRVYSNEDSADVLLAWNDVLTFFSFTERALNSIPDGDFLGDGILIPADTTGSLFSMPPVNNPWRIGGTNKKNMNRGLAIGDVDNNGTIDVVIANGLPRAGGGGGGAPNVLLLNRSDATHTAVFVDTTETHLPVERRTSGTQVVWEGINDDTMACALADFNGDGRLDLIFVNASDGTTSPTRFLTNMGGGHFVDAPRAFLPPTVTQRSSPWSIVVTDFDGKGDPTEDINGNGVLDPGEDTNHNGVLDWWDTTESEDLDGDGQLDPGEDGLPPFGPPNGRLDWADFNNDGVITVRRPGVFDASWDVLITMQDGPDILLMNSLPNPQGQFYFTDASTLLPAVWLMKFGADVGDIDLDGDVDVVIGCRNTNPNQGRVVVYLNELNNPALRRFVDASYEVPRPSSVTPAAGLVDSMHFICRDVSLTDFDNDGDLDMFLAFTGVDMGVQPLTAGTTNMVYMNRLIGDSWNSVNKFRTYRSPYLVKLSPTVGLQGSRLTAMVYFENLDRDVRTMNFGPGIAVGPIARVTSRAYSVQLQIADNAPVGPRDVSATMNNGQTTWLREAFTVLMRQTAARPMWKSYQ